MFSTLLNAKKGLQSNLKRKYGTLMRKKYNVLYHDRQILVLNKDPWMKSQFDEEALEGTFPLALSNTGVLDALRQK
jgi:23S rRNA-/tRNA-specific pseudouridylate synthase